jgi:dTDP-4-dehydrorhamnose reductase
LIHVSSDCVFSGRRGNYREDDVADPVDLYGRSKLLGEIDQPGCLTIRTSIIGRELGTSHGLIEWFLRQEGGSVAGYRQVIFSGLTTRALAELLARVIVDQPQLWGVWHIASEPISKYELLLLVRSIYGVGVEVRPDDSQRCNRSLDGRRFGQATGLVPPRWPAMLEQMCA